MKEFNIKRNVKRPIYSWFSIGLLLVLTFLLVRGAVGMVSKERESSRRMEESLVRAKELEMREAELRGNIELISTPEGVEREIREKFGVTREGEHLALVVDPQPVATSTDDMDRPWYKRLLDVIMR